MNPMIELKSVRKNYGKKEAVKGIDLTIAAGELFVLVGPNGAGKTSILKMLVGLLRPTAGTLRIGGYDIARETAQAKDLLSFVPDTPYVYEKLTPWELLRFVGKLYSMDSVLIQSRGTELLKFFSLTEVQNVLIEEFSHGMKQKAVLSASLLHQPKVLILDEPMVGLDPIAIHSLKQYLVQKTREGTTIIFSTHTLSVAEELGTRIGIIDHGQLIALGTMETLRQQFQSKENLEQMFMKLVEHAS